MHAHSALRLEHEGVSVVKIACGAFVLGAEGRVKILSRKGEDEYSSGSSSLYIIPTSSPNLLSTLHKLE